MTDKDGIETLAKFAHKQWSGGNIMCKISTRYDENYDVMYIDISEVEMYAGYSDEIKDGVILHIDLDADKVIGLTIMDYSQRNSIDKYLEYIGKTRVEEYRLI